MLSTLLATTKADHFVIDLKVEEKNPNDQVEMVRNAHNEAQGKKAILVKELPTYSLHKIQEYTGGPELQRLSHVSQKQVAKVANFEDAESEELQLIASSSAGMLTICPLPPPKSNSIFKILTSCAIKF